MILLTRNWLLKSTAQAEWAWPVSVCARVTVSSGPDKKYSSVVQPKTKLGYGTKINA